MKNILFTLCFIFCGVFLLKAQAPGDTVFIDTISFESPYHYLEIDTTDSLNLNIWQIGQPSKTIFKSAYSPQNVIVTDTVNSYPIINKSHFDLYIGEFNYNSCYPVFVYIDFRHKINTDTLKDGGYISVSYDMGKTFLNIIEDTIFNPTVNPATGGSRNLYNKNNTLFNGEYGFSGNSNEWVRTTFMWYLIPCGIHQRTKWTYVPGDTMIIRFSFISDSIDNNKEGWMIDDIRLFSEEPSFGTGNQIEMKTNIFPNPLTDQCMIVLDQEYKEITLQLYDIQGRIIESTKKQNVSRFELNTSTYKPGIYLLHFWAGAVLKGTEKLIIE
jgi:hypothetical protein